jgi:hypothetical protein
LNEDGRTRILKHVGYYLEDGTKNYEKKRSLDVAESTQMEYFRLLVASTAHICHAVGTAGCSTVRMPIAYI